MRTFSSSRIGLAALAVGTDLRAYKMVFHRADVRQAFGRKLIEHTAKAFQFADLLTRLEAAKLLIFHAAWLKDTSQDYALAAFMAKLFACQESKEITHFAAEIFGASGIMEDNPVSKFPPDAWAAA